MRRALTIFLFLTICASLTAKGDKELKKLIREYKEKMSRCRWAESQSVLVKMVRLWREVALKTAAQLAINSKRPEFVDAVQNAMTDAEDDEKALKVVAEVATKAADWRIKLMALRAIRFVQNRTVEEVVLRLLESRRPEVVREAVEAAVVQATTRIIDSLIKLYEKVEKEKGLIWLKTRQALATLCKVDFEKAADWHEWWKTKKEQIRQNEKSGRLETDEQKGMTVVQMIKKSAPKFFRTEVVSNRIIFLIDTSSSMQARDPVYFKTPDGQIIRKTKLPKKAVMDDWGGYPCLPRSRARIERVKRELIKCIKDLHPKVKFNIIAFSTGTKQWRKCLVYASRRNKAAAIAFVRSLKPKGDTYTDDAIKEAFADKEVDTICLLSDGQPWRGNNPIDVNNILEWVKKNNRFRRIVIHTFGFEQARETPNMDVTAMMRLLKGLAEQTGGSFTNIYW